MVLGKPALVNGERNYNCIVAEIPQLREYLDAADVIRRSSQTSRASCRLEMPCVAVLNACCFVAQDHPDFSYSLSLLCRCSRLLHHC